MRNRKLVGALAGVFGAVTGLFLLLGLLVTPVALGLAVPFGLAAYLLWSHASGRFATRVAAGTDARRARTERDATTGPRGERPERTPEHTPAEERAYRVLGLEPGADADAVEAAYRERVKAVHPDRGGDEQAFQRVREAYQLLAEQ